MCVRACAHTYICECAGVCLLHCAATRMQTNTTVTQLDLSDNGLGTEGTVAVADMLKENCFITHINLSDNAMGPPGAYVVGDMLLSNSSITHCYLSGMYACMLRTVLYAHMFYILQWCQAQVLQVDCWYTLQWALWHCGYNLMIRLCLFALAIGNGLSDSAAPAIAELIKVHTCVECRHQWHGQSLVMLWCTYMCI